MIRRGGVIAASIALAAVSAAAAADVEFARPSDAVFRVLYPALDPATGITPVAEPGVAAGRGTARALSDERCVAGFRIAEPRTKEWTLAGTTYLAVLYFVTTDSRPGLAAPCYKPEPWLCILEGKDTAWQPVDCATVRQDFVFPGEPSIDTAAFRLNDSETAIGARLRHETATRFEGWTNEALVLFRLHERRLAQVLAVPIGRQETDHTDNSSCTRTFVVQVEKARTAGFHDWRVRTGRHDGRAKCAADPDPTGLYRWDGSRYVRR